MLDVRNPLVWLLGLVGVVAALSLVRSYFGVEALEQRRREKSHRAVISRKQGPTVKLAVDVGKPKRDRKG